MTFGGMMSTNAGGTGGLRHDNTRALVLGLEAVMPDGRVLHPMGALHKDNSGYDLKDLPVAHLGDGKIHHAVYPARDDPAHLERSLEAIEEGVHEMGDTFSAEHRVG